MSVSAQLGVAVSDSGSLCCQGCRLSLIQEKIRIPAAVWVIMEQSSGDGSRDLKSMQE